MNEVLKSISEKVTHEDRKLSKQVQECAAESFRCLRQVCALNSDVQSSLPSCVDLLENTKTIIEKVLSLDPHVDSESVLKCAVQFLGNACVSNAANQKIIWEIFFQLFRYVCMYVSVDNVLV